MDLNLLKKARIYFNIPSYYLSKVLNISESYLNAIESGKIKPSEKLTLNIKLLVNLYLSEINSERIFPNSTDRLFLINFFNSYAPVFDIMQVHSKINSVGDKDNQICRYCGKNKEQTSFSEDTHTFPVLIGNKTLLSYDECNACNHIFAKYETSLGDYLLLERVLMRIKKRNGYPTFKIDNDIGMKFIEGKGVVAHIRQNSQSFKIDEINKRITFFSNKAYRPLHIFKILTKMALAIMPNEELKYFNKTKQWILGQIQLYNTQCPLIKTFIPGPNPLNSQIFFNLFRRKYFTENSPYMIFFIAFSNLAFQIPILLSDFDEIKKGHTLSMPIFRIPSQIYNEKYGTLQILNYDFSSNEKDYSTRTITMGYEHGEKINTSNLALKDVLYQ